MVAHLQRPDLQNVAGLLEPRQPRPKHHPDFARSGLALEMDRFASDRLRNFHALLCEKIPAPIENGGPAADVDFAAGQARGRADLIRNLTTPECAFSFPSSRSCFPAASLANTTTIPTLPARGATTAAPSTRGGTRMAAR